MSDRGIKKWAPYKSLIEQDPAILEMQRNRNKVDKPIISNEMAEEINEILTNYHGEMLNIKVYKNGEIIYIKTTLSKIDPYERKLVTPERKSIYLKDVVGITQIEY